jgi:O-antigen ligase/polysaccharide polymerase Wzy-like membrane protein
MSIASWREPGFGASLRFDAAPARAIGIGVALLSLGVITVLVQRFDAPLVLGGILLCIAAAVLVVWPDIATIAVAFALYTNIPALAARQGVPALVTSSFILLLAFPLIHHLIVRRDGFRTDRPFGWMLVFFIVLVLSSLGAMNPVAAGDRVVAFVFEGFLVYWLMINVVRTLPVLRRVIWTLLFVGGLLGGITLYQEATGSYNQEFGGLVQRNNEYLDLQSRADDPAIRELLRSLPTNQKTSRPGGPVSQANRYAQILLVLLPLAVFMARTGRSRAARLCATGLGTLTLTGVGLTQSRGAFLILVLITIAMVLLKWLRLSRVLLTALLFLGSAAAVRPSFFERLYSITNAAHLLSNDPSEQSKADPAIRGRTTVMLAAVHMFMDHPVLGVGPGQFKYHVLEYSSNPEIKFRQLETTRRAHNLYLEMAADVGLVGLAAFLAIVVHLVRKLWHARRFWLHTETESADLATAFWLSLAAYLGTGLFEHLSYERYYWFLLAIASAALHVLHARYREMQAREIGGGDVLPDTFSLRPADTPSA